VVVVSSLCAHKVSIALVNILPFLNFPLEFSAVLEICWSIPVTYYMAYYMLLYYTFVFVYQLFLCCIFKIVTVIRFMQRPQKEAPWIDYPDDSLFFLLFHPHLISPNSALVV